MNAEEGEAAMDESAHAAPEPAEPTPNCWWQKLRWAHLKTLVEVAAALTMIVSALFIQGNVASLTAALSQEELEHRSQARLALGGEITQSGKIFRSSGSAQARGRIVTIDLAFENVGRATVHVGPVSVQVFRARVDSIVDLKNATKGKDVDDEKLLSLLQQSDQALLAPEDFYRDPYPNPAPKVAADVSSEESQDPSDDDQNSGDEEEAEVPIDTLLGFVNTYSGKLPWTKVTEWTVDPKVFSGGAIRAEQTRSMSFDIIVRDGDQPELIKVVVDVPPSENTSYEQTWEKHRWVGWQGCGSLDISWSRTVVPTKTVTRHL